MTNAMYADGSRSAGTAYQPTARKRRRLSKEERRRRRIVSKLVLYGLIAFGIVIGILLTLAVDKLASRGRTSDYGRELCYSEYTVQSGDTMWDIAVDMAALNPEFRDVRQYLSLLQSTNGIYGDYLQSGTTIRIPYYATPSEKMRGGGSLEETMIETYAKYGIIQMDRWFDILGQ